MTEYTIFFIGEPNYTTQEEGKAHMVKYMEWMKMVGDKFVNRGTPLSEVAILGEHVNENSDSSKKLTGYAVIKTETKEEVLELVNKCPFLDFGIIKVCENKQMKM
jgi:hypothetical protein